MIYKEYKENSKQNNNGYKNLATIKKLLYYLLYCTSLLNIN